MRIYFVRHGQSTANNHGLFSSPDIPLTDLGRKQALELGAKLKAKDISQIVVSPDLRARQTAEVIAEQIGVDKDDIKVVEDLHERRFGHLAGTPKRPEKHYAYIFDVDGDAETRQQLMERMKRAIVKLRAMLGDKENVLVVGHTVSGYFLRELLDGHEVYEDFSQNYHLEHGSILELEI